ncbi:hypothetical protein [Parasulfitobacter algicola]|uniref:Uncharacterized protein n=1 Tax=Parasulfitobacter algicola TaxID=2614809 RepID=A0ABX2IQW5_9RHOB|nr:hypothetical protein [Sulfitobacter algicola]NSX54755.1 hypothetical protein [Sulfitobacter algicola]
MDTENIKRLRNLVELSLSNCSEVHPKIVDFYKTGLLDNQKEYPVFLHSITHFWADADIRKRDQVYEQSLKNEILKQFEDWISRNTK